MTINSGVHGFGPPPEYQARRVYFEALTANLMVQGMSGEQIGTIIGELDSHLEATHADPVEELGPVNEFAESLLASTGRVRWSAYVLRALAFGVASGLFAAAMSALNLRDEGAGHVEFALTRFLMMVTVVAGVTMLSMSSALRTDGRGRRKLPRLRWIAVYFALGLGVPRMVGDASIEMPVPVAWVLLVFGALAAIGVMVEWFRFGRVSVPGNARHLRGLEWGRIGRSA